jgi:dihydroflavonol-4-reductase
MLLGFLNGEMPAYLDCAFNMADVRDVAAGHILAAERGRVGERYILGGENLRLSDVLAILEELTGRPMPKLKVPVWLALASGVVSEFVADHVTHRPPKAPLTGVRLAARPMTFDNAKARAELGFSPRPVREALAAAVAWFEAEGLLRPGRSGSSPRPSRRS